MAKPSPWGGEPAELAPCPFCGGTRIGLHHDLCPSPSGESVYHEAVAACSSCEIVGPRVAVPDTPNIDGWLEARLQAIAAWNRRTPNDSNPGTLNALPANDIHPSSHPNPGTPSQSREPSASDVDPQKILYELDRNSTDVDLYPSVRATCRLAAQLIRARIALGEREP